MNKSTKKSPPRGPPGAFEKYRKRYEKELPRTRASPRPPGKNSPGTGCDQRRFQRYQKELEKISKSTPPRDGDTRETHSQYLWHKKCSHKGGGGEAAAPFVGRGRRPRPLFVPKMLEIVLPGVAVTPGSTFSYLFEFFLISLGTSPVTIRPGGVLFGRPWTRAGPGEFFSSTFPVLFRYFSESRKNRSGSTWGVQN